MTGADDPRLCVDRCRSARLWDVGGDQRYTAAAVVAANGDTHLVLIDETDIGARFSLDTDIAAPHEAAGTLTPEIAAKITAAGRRGRAQGGGTP
jgi:hypothetical protein